MQLSTGIKGADATLAICGTIIEANGAQHAILSFVVKENTPTLKLPDLTLHWWVPVWCLRTA